MSGPQARRDCVAREARSWLETRYHHQADRKGAGVDCAMLLVRVYADCGEVPADLDPRPYAHDWHQHHGDELYLDWLERFAARLPDDALPQVADIAVWKFGLTFSHGAIVMGEGHQAPIIHALLRSRKVCWGALDDPLLAAQPRRLYRLPALTDAPKEEVINGR